MGIGHKPRNKQHRLGADKAASRPNRGDEFFDLLSPLLKEAATFPDDASPRRKTPSARSLREENARLRALAVQLSNLLGDLPAQEWEDAARS